MSGNVIDLCPVGALVSKPYRFSARAWEMTSHPLVSPHDGVGTNLYGHVLRGRLMRVIPRENEAINETWIADRDRFSYEGIYSPDRILTPMIRQAGAQPGGGRGDWIEADWETALAKVAQGLKSRAADLGMLASSTSTLEELYLLGRLARGLGTANIDHRLRQRDFRDQDADPAFPSLGMRIADVDALSGLLLVGTSLRREVPILAHRVRKAALRGARIVSLSPVRAEYLFPVAVDLISAPAKQVEDLAAILSAASSERFGSGPWLCAIHPMRTCAHWRQRSRKSRGLRSACWPREAMPREPTWPVRCRIAKPAANQRARRACQRWKCSNAH
jgi:NADH-quinone oxidoreductase subunit G